ncbi:adenylate kinase family protein [uncultured Methanobrevibacter sp.]|uniref:adenylate kinase family protein n=1 Tax=uncultured Methanobrevibacter sp. TaxID=253161 RepID=UPI002622180D
MSLNENIVPNKVIFISGTPCTGKTTLAIQLNKYLMENNFNSRLIKINDFAIEHDLVLGEDPDKFYKVIDIERLNLALNEEIKSFLSNVADNEILIVEGHLSHLCEGADKMIVLRLNPNELKSRLMERKYTESKIQENLEAEALAVCSAEAYELYGEGIDEIDSTAKSVEEVLNLIIDIIFNNASYPVGMIDFMDWFLV